MILFLSLPSETLSKRSELCWHLILVAHNNATTFSRIQKWQELKFLSPISIMYLIPAAWLHALLNIGRSLLHGWLPHVPRPLSIATVSSLFVQSWSLSPLRATKGKATSILGSILRKTPTCPSYICPQSSCISGKHVPVYLCPLRWTSKPLHFGFRQFISLSVQWHLTWGW